MAKNVFRRGILIFIIVIVLSLVSGANAVGERGKVDSQIIEDISSKGSADVIVILNDNSAESAGILSNFEVNGIEGKKDSIKRAQDEVLESINSIKSAQSSEKAFSLKYRYSTINALSMRIDSETLRALENNPLVESITVNPQLNVVLNESLSRIKVPNVQQVQIGGVNLTGAGETVCILDTGIDSNHEAFTNKIIGGYDFENGDSDPEDDHGHGTHVAGIAAGNGSQFKGVAPDANIVAMKVCDAAGSCGFSEILAGFDWCVNNASALNISAISISIADGGQYNSAGACPDLGLKDAIDTARGMGILVSIASGNNGYTGGISFPACVANATSVGSVLKDDTMMAGTNRGTLLDILAPGFQVYSATFDGSYGVKTGTSMAAPHIAGVDLLLHQAIRLKGLSKSVDDIENAMKSSATIFAENFPRIDAISSLNYLQYGLIVNSSENSVIRTGAGKIKFGSNPVFGDLGECVNVSNNSAFIGSDASCSRYNRSAEITLENLPWIHFVAYKDGAICSSGDCNVTESGNTAIISVNGAGNYSIGGIAGLSISDDTDSLVKRKNQQVKFYANFTDSLSSAITDATCSIDFNITGDWQDNAAMTYNATNGLFEYSRSFSNPGTFYFNSTCDGTSSGNGMLSETGNIIITNPINMTNVFVNASSSRNLTEDSITCWANAAHLDGTDVSYEVDWYKNGALNLSVNSSSYSSGTLAPASTLTSAQTSNSTWSCRARANDGIDYSDYKTSSNNVTLVDKWLISACKTISEGGQYMLTRNITGVVSCLTINASNVEIDGRGYTIQFTGTAALASKGIVANTPVSNLTIKNLILKKTTNFKSNNYAIYLNQTSNSNIFNNTISINGTSYDIGIFMNNSNSNTVSNNIISTLGNSGYNYGIQLINSGNNIFESNTINTLYANSDAFNIASGNNQFINNNANTTQPTSYDFRTLNDAGNNTVTNLTLVGNGVKVSFVSDSNSTMKSVLQADVAATPAGNISINKYFNLTTVNPLLVNVGYTDAELTSSNASESSLRIFKSDAALNWVADGFFSESGVNAGANSVYANITSSGAFGVFGLADTAAPSITIINPENTTYTNATILVNISSDGNNVWFTNSSGQNETYTTPVYRTFSEGTNTIYAYTNDSAGNSNSTSATFFVDSIVPLVTITSPANTTYTSNSINVNISLDEIGYCEYSIDGGVTNKTLTTADNLTFIATESGLANGNYVLNAYCRDAYGNRNDATSVNFTVSVASAPPAGGGGGGGGGGSSSSAPVVNTNTNTIVQPIVVDESSLDKGYENTISAGNSISFSVSSESHSLKVDKVENNSATITISSNPITLTLGIGESKEIDIDEDKSNDLFVELRNITADKKVDIRITKIQHAVANTASLAGNSSKESKISDGSASKTSEQTEFSKIMGSAVNSVGKAGTPILLAVLFIIGVVALRIFYKRRNAASVPVHLK